MVKYFVFLGFLFFSSLGSFSFGQDVGADNTTFGDEVGGGGGSVFDNEFDQSNAPTSPNQTQPTCVAGAVWNGTTCVALDYAYCNEQGLVYSPAGQKCIDPINVCANIFGPGTEDESTCVEEINECTANGGSQERCLCKAGGGISLNTNVPFIGSCIFMNTNPGTGTSNATLVDETTAFPRLIGGLSRILVTAILVFSFVMIIVGGVMMTMGGADQSQYDKGKSYIIHVVTALAILGASGLILRLINPNFFG